jgi:hypothetical protein
MPQNVETATLTDVIKFFVLEIDGMGLRDGHLRNLAVPAMLESYTDWKLCDLSEDEFMRLIIPDKFKPLLRNKDLESVEGDDSIATMDKYAEQLERNESLPALILRTVLPGETALASYYIEDGAHKALGYKKYFQNHPYQPVRAFIGTI